LQVSLHEALEFVAFVAFGNRVFAKGREDGLETGLFVHLQILNWVCCKNSSGAKICKKTAIVIEEGVNNKLPWKTHLPNKLTSMMFF
jgi:hypothetical protein